MSIQGPISHSRFLYTPSTHPSLVSINASTQLPGWVNKIVQVFKRIIEACLRCFRPASINTCQREHRIREGADDIQARLQRELNHAADQMAHEPDKAFVYQTAPAAFTPSHEEIVGNYSVGITHHQGPRPSMEDEHIAVSCNVTIAGTVYPISIFGIFDGHGGALAAQFIRDNLQRKLQETLPEFNPQVFTDTGIWNALKMTCVRLNEDFKSAYIDGAPSVPNNQGSTGTFVVILNDKLWAANVGDSRIIIDNNGTPIQLTEDAKPNDPRYKRGIEHRGGRVFLNAGPRINGDLAVARAFGDFRLNGVSARPKITMIPLSELDPNFQLLLLCDGLADVASTRQLVQACHTYRDLTPGILTQNLVYSTNFAGSGDNQSAMIVRP